MTKLPVGFIGLNGRGRGLLNQVLAMDDIDVKVICDKVPERLELAKKACEDAGKPADATLIDEEVAARSDIEAVIIPSSWNDHIPLAVMAMRSGKYAAIEVGPAQSVDQCFDLVRTYEATKVPCMLLENCCYGEAEMTVLNMIKKGLFGEVVHCAGGYQHDLRILGSQYDEGKERAYHYMHRNAELYPTHELGPIMSFLNINRGNRMLSLTATASKARGLKEYVRKNLPADHPLQNMEWRLGDIVTTVIKCAGGETIQLTHDTTLPRPYSRGGRVDGTQGIWMEDKNAAYIEGRREGESWEPFENFKAEYGHPLWKAYYSEGVRGGHGGMDYLVLRAFLHAVRRQIAPPIDAYDTAAMMSISCLSEKSILLGSMPVEIPDFTNGRWIKREPAPDSIFALDKVNEALFENLESL